jgi:hypothetical protein
VGKYIGFKSVEAEPCTVEEFNKIRPLRYSGESQEGYKVVYQDGYVSWSPKDVFEKAYMQVGDNNTITQENVELFLKSFQVITLDDNKTTVVKAELVNGFTIVESSSCVDPANYDENIGADICLNRIKNKIWELLGFLLQTANNGR